jgi:hypothetical protein
MISNVFYEICGARHLQNSLTCLRNKKITVEQYISSKKILSIRPA